MFKKEYFIYNHFTQHNKVKLERKRLRIHYNFSLSFNKYSYTLNLLERFRGNSVWSGNEKQHPVDY